MKPSSRSRLRPWLRAAVAALALLLAGELVAERGLGLGDPPLMQADPQIEYLFQPNQTCRRFHNLVHYNAWSMRSDDFSALKPPGEYRVLVIGDSVVNGGSQTDQGELATSILQRRLGAAMRRPVIVGNVSAGSWGPPNQLAYVRRFGLFGADVVVLVWSSHDATDMPTFAPTVGVLPDYPDHRPACAIAEGVTRYLLPRLRRTPSPPGDAPPSPPDAKAVAECAAAEGELIDTARAAGARVIVIQHAEAREAGGIWQPGHDEIRAVCLAHGMQPIDDAPAFLAAQQGGRQPYRDHIHPSAAGQGVLSDVLFHEITAR